MILLNEVFESKQLEVQQVYQICEDTNIISTVVMGLQPQFAFYIASLAFQNEKLLLEDWLTIKSR